MPAAGCPPGNPFSQVLDAWRVGDLRRWRAWMAEHEDYWVAKGQFLVVERLTTYAWRNYLRRVYVYCNT